eukprot:1820827-Prymnesium_polylepis.1
MSVSLSVALAAYGAHRRRSAPQPVRPRGAAAAARPRQAPPRLALRRRLCPVRAALLDGPLLVRGW